MRGRPTALAGLFLAAALSLTACGGDADPDAGDDTPVVEATENAPVARDSAELTQAIGAALQAQQTFVATADVDAAGMQMAFSGPFRLSGSGIEADLTMELPADAGGNMRAVIVGGQFFLQSDGFGLPAETPWLGVTPGADDPISQAMGPMFDELSKSADPSRSLGILPAAGELQPAGAETVDGVETTKYDATIDVAAALGVVEGTIKEDVQALVDSGVTTAQMSIWVDGDDLLRKFVMTMDAGGQTVTTTATYSRFGEAVEIVAPPADQVADPATFGMS